MLLHPWQFGSALPWLDLFGIAVFAITGALAAAGRGQTFVTAAFFALVTGVGGGSVRDLLIGAPVFWVHDPLVAAICLAVAVLVWVTPRGWWRGPLGQTAALDWLDAVGLAAYAVFGAAKALAFGVPPVPAALMGVGDGVRRRHHPRRTGGRAVDPDAPGTVRDGRGAGGGAARGVGGDGGGADARRADRGGGGVCPARGGYPLAAGAAGVWGAVRLFRQYPEDLARLV